MGSLLTPLVDRFRRDQTQVFCIDSDLSALSAIANDGRFVSGLQCQWINDDFLEWSRRQPAATFDCILMNPPFSAMKPALRRITLPSNLSIDGKHERYMPVEAAFLSMSVNLLGDKGRLLAILPCSVVMSQSLQWMRRLLFREGAVRSVHELPPRCFPGVESRMYLLVYDKAARQRSLTLYNHDLDEPIHVSVSVKNAVQVDRLDFGYFAARQKTRALLLQDCFDWRRLHDVAVVWRGDVRSPIGSLFAIHTCDYAHGSWHRPVGVKLPTDRKDARTVTKGDLLVKRVGRNAYQSFGRYLSEPGIRCSDCVLIIRPRINIVRNEMLFALRTLSELRWLRPLLERGTGASYITMSSLSELWVPMRLHQRFPEHFGSFEKSLNSSCNRGMLESTKLVAKELDRLANCGANGSSFSPRQQREIVNAMPSTNVSSPAISESVK